VSVLGKYLFTHIYISSSLTVSVLAAGLPTLALVLSRIAPETVAHAAETLLGTSDLAALHQVMGPGRNL
jgi:hypothetical protein